MRARLRAVPFNLSQRRAMKRFREQDFLAEPDMPKWGKTVIVERTRLTHVEAGLPKRGGREIDEPTDDGQAFRDTLFAW